MYLISREAMLQSLTNTILCCAGDHSGAGGGAGRWGTEAEQLSVHARRTQSPREAAQRRQRRVAQVTLASCHHNPPPPPLMVASNGLFLCPPLCLLVRLHELTTLPLSHSLHCFFVLFFSHCMLLIFLFLLCFHCFHIK